MSAVGVALLRAPNGSHHATSLSIPTIFWQLRIPNWFIFACTVELTNRGPQRTIWSVRRSSDLHGLVVLSELGSANHRRWAAGVAGSISTGLRLGSKRWRKLMEDRFGNPILLDAARGEDRNSEFDLEVLLHPGRRFAHPMDVVRDPDLSLGEKRAILASWASDACAIEAAPALRCAPGSDNPVKFDEVMDALRMLDANQQCSVEARQRHPSVIAGPVYGLNFVVPVRIGDQARALTQ